MIRIVQKGIAFFKRKAYSFLEWVKYYSVYFFAIVIYRKREAYLVSERGVDARDNGYHFFKYLREKFPDKEVYYVINKKSSDYINVKPYGNIIEYRSLKHYLLFIGAKYKISTHIMGYSPDFLFYTSFNKKHRVPGKQIFLQHGIIKDNLVGLYQENTLLDVFICGAYPEYKYVSENFHYNNGEVKYTGLARYDNLQQNTLKRQILVMPTWRQYLKGNSEIDFKNSDYFKLWNKLLNDQRVIENLENNHMQLLFYPHYEMQQYVKLFSSGSDRVVIADFDHYDVQTLLKESMLLITDFSSVFFDFAYMLKPMIFFQFDREAFFSTHYQKGYFDYDKMGFGEVALTYEALIQELILYLGNGCKKKQKYVERIQKFFPLHDCNNCERIMEVL